MAQEEISVRILSVFLALTHCGICSTLSIATAASDSTVQSQRISSHPLAPFPYLQPGETTISDSAVSRLSEQIIDFVQRGQIVGAEVLVVKGGKIAWHQVFGLADLETGEPMTPAGVFRIRSMTKPILGTAALRLIEQGKLRLDDQASEYIPSFATEKGKQVTVRRLLEHSTGFEFSPFPRARESYTTLRESVNDLATIGPQNPPGEFRYSDAGSATLGAIVEVATGMPLEEVLRREIFEPLKMRDTRTMYSPDSSWSDRMNSTHNWDQETQSHRRYWHRGEAQEMPYFRASGGVYSTVFDYAVFLENWLRALRNENPGFISQETAKLALTQATKIPYGLHFETANDEAGHPLVFGHSGSDGTMGLCIPEEDMLLLFFTQSRRCDCRDQFGMLAGLTGEFGPLSRYSLFGQWRDDQPVIEPSPLEDSIRAKYTGWYDVSGGTVEVVDQAGWLRFRRGMSRPLMAQEMVVMAQSSPEIVCRPVLSAPFPSVDLIPLGEDDFSFGRVVDGAVVEVYWPDRELRFEWNNGEVIGYSFEYEPQLIERARKYQWKLAAPVQRREPLPGELAEAFHGTYEPGYYGALAVRAGGDFLVVEYGNGADTLSHQGAGYFTSQRGDIVTFTLNPASRKWRLSVFETDGNAYYFERSE